MKIYIILICFVVFSCTKKDVFKFDEKLIEKIASEDFSLPSRYNMFNLYVKCENDKLSQVNIQQLKNLYSKSDQRMTFQKYLNVILNQEQELKESIDMKCFSLNSELKKEYEEYGIQSIIKKYFEKADTSYSLKKGITEEKRITLFYFCFLNNYLGTFDDYIGCYYLAKVNDLY